jgi:hypothetical protein
MSIFKKIFVLIIVSIFFYILYSLISTSTNILNQKESFIEGIDQVGIDASKIKGDKRIDTVGIDNINPALSDRPLREYVIKSSYNTALTGKFVSLDMVKEVLKRGCRFLDFEIFYDGKNPFVSYSTDATYKTLQTDSSFTLTSVFNTVMGSAFNSDAPNPHDPLFIQLRVKSNNEKIYKAVASSINSSLMSKLYPDKITKDTKLKDIMKKVILVMDKTINIDYKKFTDCSNNDANCHDLKNYINIESGSELMLLSRYTDMLERATTPPQINDDNNSTTVSRLNVVMPDIDYNSGVANPKLFPFVLKYGCQMVLYRFYNKDTELESYEDFFKNFKTAFVPLTRAIPYLQKKSELNVS